MSARPALARPALARRALAEFLGTGLLVTIVVGSGIAAQRLSADGGLQLLENSTATVFGLAVLILLLGPVSGAHFNPVVSTTDALLGRRTGTGLPAGDLVLAVVGVRPNTALLEAAGATLGAGRAVVVDEQMRTGLPHVFAAGDGIITHHRLLGTTYLPLGTTSHKQGRVAGENAVGGLARFAGSVGTQVVKVFDLVASRTGLRDQDATAAGYSPATVQSSADDHKRYYPGAQPITFRITGDTTTGRLLGAQLVGRLGTETAKRVDTFATALHAGLTVAEISDLDLSYTPPLGSPWDAVQAATQAWTRSLPALLGAPA